jgi:hypothetical protein
MLRPVAASTMGPSGGTAAYALPMAELITAAVGSRKLAGAMCSCGNCGCGNAGIQQRKQVVAGDLPALVALLRTLPWSDFVPTRQRLLSGDGLAALPVPRASGPSKIVYHGAQMHDGMLAPVTRALRDWSDKDEPQAT